MLNTIQCLSVGDELNLAIKLVTNAISGRVQLARYIRVSIALRYGTSGPRTSLLSSRGRNGFFSTFNDITTNWSA